MINQKVISIILKYSVLNGLRHITLRLRYSWVAEKKLGLGMHNGVSSFLKEHSFHMHLQFFYELLLQVSNCHMNVSQISRKKQQVHRKY